MFINLYMLISKTQVLGGNTRYAIWVQGCSFHCKGCLASDAFDPAAGTQVLIADLAKDICKTTKIEGITISGGEPFDQSKALASLILQIRQQRDLGVIVYSGYKLSTLKRKLDPDISAFLSQIDLLIDGKYIAELDDGASLRGSSNQVVHALSDRYKNDLNLYGQPGRKVEWHLDPPKLIGLPSKNILKIWQERIRK